MKTIYLVRHAKSSWAFDTDDHDRPLNERGLSDAPLVAAAFSQKMPKPDIILSSTALRSKTTALFFAKAYEMPDSKIQLVKELYDFTGQPVVDVICKCDNAIDTIMIFGHNNAMTNVVNFYGDQRFDNVPTTGCTVLQFDIDNWDDLTQGKTIYALTPKQLK